MNSFIWFQGRASTETFESGFGLRFIYLGSHYKVRRLSPRLRVGPLPQLMVLSKASQRDDGAAVVPDRMNKAAVAKVAASLVGKKLMREVRAKPGVPVWRNADDGRALSLVLLRAGRDALGVDEAPADGVCKSVPDAKSPEPIQQDPPVSPAPRSGGKQALLVSILSGPSGATLTELMAATGWLAHTTRAALTGLRQRGYVIGRTRRPYHPTTWRIAAPPISGRGSAPGRAAHPDQV